MPNLAPWIRGASFWSTPQLDIDFVMARLGQSIVLVREGTSLAAQTALLAPMSQAGASEAMGAAGKSGTGQLVVVGYRGRTDVANLDIQRGDRFKSGSSWFKVEFINETIPGRVEAVCGVTQ